MKLRRVLAALLAVLTILAAPGVMQAAQAADTAAASVSHCATKAYKVKVTASMLNIRKSASNKSDITGLLKKGNVVTITAEKKDNRGVVWGKTSKGWINLGYTQKINSINYNATITVPSLNVRKAADHTSKVTKVLKKGAKVTIVDEKKDSRGIVWGKLKDGTGWINLDYTKGEKKASYKVVVTAKAINIRQFASISAKTTGTLNKGTVVSITAERKDSRGITWVKLANGKGWISLDVAKKTSNQAVSPYKVKVTASSLSIRKSGNLSAKVTGYLKQNTTVTITAEQKDSRGVTWGQLSDGRGWISLKFAKKV